MATIGSIKGTLKLHIEGIPPLILGNISIPVTAKTKSEGWSGGREITIGVDADMEDVRKTVENIFKKGKH